MAGAAHTEPQIDVVLAVQIREGTPDLLADHPEQRLGKRFDHDHRSLVLAGGSGRLAADPSRADDGDLSAG